MKDDFTKKLLPWLVAVAFFMEFLDTTILNTAAPVIAKAMNVEPLSMKAVLACYTLSLAVFIPISGWMADQFGTRRVFSSAIGLFVLGSFLCGISTNIHELVAFRILQGCGGAMMLPVGRITIARYFSKSELVRALSFVVIPGLVGPMLGPIAGGLIVEYWHWSIIFFVNIPIGLVGLYLVYQYLPDYREKNNPRLDIIGLILFGSGISLLSYVLEVFGEHTLTTTEIVLLLTFSGLQLIGYQLYSARVKYPLLRLKLFRIRTFCIAVSGSFFTRIGIGGIPFLLPLLYQVGFGFTPIQSGLMMLPQAVAAIGLKFFVQNILSRYGYRRVLISNTVGMGVMIILFSTIGLTTSLWQISLLLFIFGVFTSMQFTCMNSLVYADINDSQTSSASSISSTVQQLSMSFGVASASLIAAIFIPDRASPLEMIQGIQWAFIVLGVMTIIATLVFLGLKNDDGAVISHHKKVISELK